MNINLTLLGQMITFVLFVWFTKAKVWPPIMAALKERQAKIADGLAAAERGHLELEQAKQDIAQLLKQAKTDAENIIVSGKKEADNIIDAARVKAHEQGQKIIEQAKLEIDQLANNAKQTLLKEVGAIVLTGAEKVVGHSVNDDTNRDLLVKLVEEI